MRSFPLLLIFLTGCSSYIASMQEEKRRSDISYDEMRIEIADLKHALHATQVELNILEERVRKQEGPLAHNKQPPSSKSEPLSQQLSQLEKKLAGLQITQEHLLQDIQKLRTHAQDTSLSLQDFAREIQAQNKRFEEISQLKTTLSSLSKAIEPADTKHAVLHRVQGGETLEKIARLHHTTVIELKRLNKLENDRIVIGQELKLP